VRRVEALASWARGVGIPDWGPRDSSFAFDGKIRVRVDCDRLYVRGRRSQTSRRRILPEVSPDGQHIAFMQRSSANVELIDQLWLMNRDGTGARGSASMGPSLVTLGPSSHEVTYVRLNAGDTSYVNGTIVDCRYGNTAERQVTFNPDP